MMEVVFDPEKYVSEGGVIIDCDLEWHKRELARQRSMKRIEIYKQRKIRLWRRYMLKQRVCGVFCFVFASIIWMLAKELIIASAILILLGSALLLTSDPIWVDEYWFLLEEQQKKRR